MGNSLKKVALFLALNGLAGGQTPTGTIAGVILDPSGAAVKSARVRAERPAKGLVRTVASCEQGGYSFPALLPGEYELSIEAAGFKRMVRLVAVEAGATTTADFTLRVGEVNESLTVEGASPQIRHDSHSVGGLIAREQIQDLPLNGRGFLELAKLEPGVQAPSRGDNNRTFVPVLGAPMGTSGRGTRVTVDGGSIMAVGNGGSAMGFSQEVVQEFQTATVNFDLSTGLTFAGALNAVTRSGGNDVHGTAFYFFRDHALEAYPALRRQPANPDPFFQRRQFGLALGGPIRRDRAFYFVNWERHEQRGVVATTLVAPEFAHFSRITTSPLFGDQVSVRLDGRLSGTHSAFVRYSHDGSRAFSPSLSPFASAIAIYPSQWARQSAWVDQSILGLTSVFRATLVNDLHFSYFFISSHELPSTERDCLGCLGVGAPTINIDQARLFLGSSSIGHNLGRRFHLHDSVTWQRGAHRARFGADWEHHRGGLLTWFSEPATLRLYSPQQARPNSIPVPAAFRTLDDILQLPLQTVTVAVGEPRVPQEDGGLVRKWNTARLYFHDVWRLHSRLTFNYGLGWSIDRNLNYDLSKPALLEPILGSDGLGPTRKQWKNLSPVLGFAWGPTRDNKTVVRAGAGIFYDFFFPPNLDGERAALGPPGLGRQTFEGSSILNTLPGIPGVPIGRALNFPNTPTAFTGAHLLSILPAVRSDLLQRLSNSDPSLRAVEVTKQVTVQFGGGLIPSDLRSPSALHANVGLQREIARDFVVSADFAYRHFTHVGVGFIDLNHVGSVGGPVIPFCSPAQENDPQALCSRGPISVFQNPGLATYKGLLLRADNRFSRGFQFLGSWAYSRNTGTNIGNGFKLDNWLLNHGPLTTDFTHIGNLAGVVQLPWRLQLGLNFSYSSSPPLSAFVGGIDFNGDGTTGDLLPESTVNAFNRGLDPADLERLVAQFNQNYAGTLDGKNAVIPKLTLPERYWLSDNFHSMDLRLTRSFLWGERWRLSLIGEVFNLYNAANLLGFSGDLTSPAFGQATSRFTQVFGSGGPRAFQLALRVSY